MTTIIKAADAAQFVSMVPSLLGCRPSESLVLVPFRGNRTLGAMRLDLPHDDGVDLDAYAATAIGMMCRVDGADAIAIVVYSSLPFDDGPPRADLVGAVLRRADEVGLAVTDALGVADDAWGSYLVEDDPGGRPLSALNDPDPQWSVAADQRSGADLPRSDLAVTERVARALIGFDAAASHLLSGAAAPSPYRDRVDPQALAAAAVLDDIPWFFEHAIECAPAELDPFEAAALVWCLDRPALRDVAISQWFRDIAAGDKALTAQLRWQSGEEYPAELALFMTGDGERPDAGRLARALELARWVAAVAPRAQRPGALATCAWLAWALGRSTHAASYAMDALQIDPSHGLSEIVMTMVSAAHLPDWAFRDRGRGARLT